MKRLLDRVVHWSSTVRPEHYLLVCLLPVLLLLPSRFADPTIDDLFHTALVKGGTELVSSGLWYRDLFVFFDGSQQRAVQMVRELGLPWWTDADIRIAFFRPLTALTHWADTQAGLSYAGKHVVSAVFYGLLCFSVWLLYRSVLASVGVALLAALLFAFDFAHFPSVVWIANRNALLALAFGALSVTAHHRWREGATGWGLLAAGAFLASLLSAEAGISTAFYLLAYALFLDADDRRRRIFSLLPYVVIAVAWLGIYKHLHFGAGGNDFYLDPAQAPLVFLRQLLWRGPLFVLIGWIGVPSQFYYASAAPAPAAALIIGAWVVTLAVLALLWPLLRRQPLARFFLAGALLSILPIAGSLPHERSLAFVSVGTNGLLALTIAAIAGAVPQFMSGARILLWPLLGFVLLVRLLIHPLGFAGVPWVLGGAAATTLDSVVRGLPAVDQSQRGWIFVNPPNTMQVPTILLRRDELGLPLPPERYVLARSDRNASLTLKRVGDSTIELSAASLVPTKLPGRYELLFRSSAKPLAPDQQFDIGGMSATVLKLGVDGWPNAALFQWQAPLETYRWFCWKDGVVREMVVPAVGESGVVCEIVAK